MVKRSLIGLCKEFLSLPGEDLPVFSAQYKRLTEKDKTDLIAEFAKIGFEATVAVK